MNTFKIDEANTLLQDKTALERVAYGIETFGDKAVLLSSMQKTASVLMHFFYTLGVDNEILFVDTGFHFQETLVMRDEFMRRYKLNIVTLYPELTPEQQEEQYDGKLYQSFEGQPVCCELRKGVPFINYILQQEHKVVYGGLRRAEGSLRGNLQIISEDPRINGFKVNPILDWSDAMVDNYLRENAVPVHPLHAQSYPSIGCQCCTTPVKEGEKPRAGRWRHLREEGQDGPEYCEMNFSDGAGI